MPQVILNGEPVEFSDGPPATSAEAFVLITEYAESSSAIIQSFLIDGIDALAFTDDSQFPATYKKIEVSLVNQSEALAADIKALAIQLAQLSQSAEIHAQNVLISPWAQFCPSIAPDLKNAGKQLEGLQLLIEHACTRTWPEAATLASYHQKLNAALADMLKAFESSDAAALSDTLAVQFAPELQQAANTAQFLTQKLSPSHA